MRSGEKISATSTVTASPKRSSSYFRCQRQVLIREVLGPRKDEGQGRNPPQKLGRQRAKPPPFPVFAEGHGQFLSPHSRAAHPTWSGSRRSKAFLFLSRLFLVRCGVV